MATLSKKNESTYAGFLNGYIAGNLSANSKELYFHNDKISSFLDELKDDVQKWKIDAEDNKKFSDLFNQIYDLKFANDTNYYLQLGDLLLSVYALIAEVKKADIPSSASFCLKKIIYHYLNIASTLKDTGVSKKAREIVKKFESK